MKNFEISQGKEPIRITLSEYNEKKYIDLRKYYQTPNGDFAPTKKGVTINDSKAFIDFLDFLNENKKEIEEWLKK